MNAKQGQRWGIILILLGFAIGIPGFWLLIAHDHFEATVRIEITKSAPEASVWGNLPYDPYFIQTEFEVIKSETVLRKVVETLHLDAEWGNRFAEGRKLELTETLDLLKQSLRLRSDDASWFWVISVKSEDPVEAAKIANAVAESYRDFQAEHIPHTCEVKILQIAQPPTVPIGPNRTLGKALLGVGVLLLVCGFVTFVRHWRTGSLPSFSSPPTS